MKSKWLSLIGLILVFTSSIIRGQAKETNSLLWEISGNGLEEPSYLFGTIHIICPSDYFWTDSFEEAFQKTKQLYLEMDMSDEAILSKMQEAMMQSGNKDWFLELDDQQKTEVKEMMAQMYGMEANMIADELFQEFSLFVLAQMIIMLGLECDLPKSYDLDILAKAQAASMPIKGLEGLEVQLKAIESISIEDVLNTSKNEEFQMNHMVQIYKDQNIDELYQLTSKAQVKATDVLLKDRNHNWIPVIEEAAKGQATFFAVGAAHLSGEDGVIQLLRNKGYTLKAIK